MKIDKVIFSCDLNPQYVGFWNSISRHVNEFLNLETQLICIGDPSGFGMSEKHGEVKVVEKLSEYPGILQALWAKFWYTSQESETTWMIGDLDLYPLQKKWFLSSLEHLDENAYAHLNPDAYGEQWYSTPTLQPGCPGYYHVAKGKVFADMLELHDTFEEAIKFMYEAGRFGIGNQGHAHNAGEYSKRIPHWEWFGAEEHYTKELLLPKKDKVIGVKSGVFARVDRSDNCNFELNQLISGHYVDMHSIRPYEAHSAEIERVLQLVRENVK